MQMFAELELFLAERTRHLEYHVAEHQGRIENRNPRVGFGHELPVEIDKPALCFQICITFDTPFFRSMSSVNFKLHSLAEVRSSEATRILCFPASWTKSGE